MKDDLGRRILKRRVYQLPYHSCLPKLVILHSFREPVFFLIISIMSFRILRVAPLLILCTSLSWAQPINLPGWQEGYLDIHHISTGSGNAAFLIFPDGTNMLFDAGDVDREARLKYPNPLKVSPHLPDESVSAAQCIATYIREVLPTISHIDYVVISHFHSDHFGSAGPRSKLSKKGDYRLSGITEVNELIPIKKLIDRAYPTYQFPFDLRTHIQDKESFSHYLKFIHSQIDAHRLSVESLKAGSNLQIIQTITPKNILILLYRILRQTGKYGQEKRIVLLI